jgi:hypothetical protein
VVRLLVLAFLLTLASCNSEKASDVEINTSGIFTPVSITYSGNTMGDTYDFGEYLIGMGPQTYPITITNNSLFPLTDLILTLDTFESFGFSFEKTEDGKNKFPGKTGTCTSTLLPAQSCTIALQFETNISKFYEQQVTVKYLNYIEGASRTINLQVLAGNPASLVFENEETNYYFGELVGMAQIPVIEREIVQEYSQVLKVTNAGDLKARDLTNSNIILSQTCNSAATKSCPVGQNSAYRITHNCPTELKQDEFCHVTVYFKPLNQALTAEMKNIRYDSVLKMNYKTSSQGTVATLNGYITTNSVNIEAKFDTSIESQIFENTIVVGNRDVRAFRVNNRGYRSGFMRKLIFKDLFGVHYASCVANPLTTPWLECYDNLVTNVKTLADFPFKIKDKNACLESPFDNGKVIPVDQGCAFDIQFQPSKTYVAPKLFELEVFAEYDALWKGLSSIQENQLHTLTAQSLHAAKIIPTTIVSAGSGIPAEVGTDDTLVTYNAGRLGLMSQSNFRRKPMLVTFKNVGGVAATAIVAKDGRNNIIPQKELNPSGISIGVLNPHYYINSLITTSNCTEILPNQACTLQFSFAPITHNDWDKNADNMFDVIFPPPGPYLDSYKQFIMTYLDGTNYSDSNTNTAVVDSGPNQGESRLKADLVEKGQLDDYTTENFGIGQQNQGTEYKREIRFSNIGTKDIPYVHYVGSIDLKSLTKSVKVVPTNPLSLDPNTLDCSTIFDFAYVAGDSLAAINARSATWDPFPVSKDCLLTLHYFPSRRSLTSDDSRSGVTLLEENARNTYIATNSSIFGWDFESNRFADFDFILDAYDGDLTDPTATGPYAAVFGKYLQGKTAAAGGAFYQLAKITPYAPRPMAGSIIYRPGWTRPSVADESGVTFLTGSTIPEAWFFSDYTEQNTAFVGYDADFFKGLLSKNFFPLSMSLPTLTDYEFIYYMGTVPSGTPLNGSLILANTGRPIAALKTTTINTILSPNSTINHFTTNMTTLANPTNVMPATSVLAAAVTPGLNTSYVFSGTDSGVYAAELLINYQDGGYDSAGPYMLPFGGPDPRVKRTVQRKILIVAEVSNATPTLKLDVQDYDVATDDLTPAVESLGAITTTPMSYFEGTTPVLNFTSIKIPSPARKDSFLKKRFIFYNTSGTTAINEIKLFFRATGSSTIKDGIQSPSSYYLCMNGSQTNPALAAVDGSNVAQPMCTGTCGTTAFNLAPGGSCYIELRYQPTGSVSAKSVTLTALHKVGTDRYVHRNLDLTFQPQDPAAVAVTNRSPQVIRTSLGTLSSYNIDFGSPVQTANPMVFTYNAPTTGGWNKMLQMNNPSTTKASFLKSYQLYYKQFIDTGISDSALKVKEPVYPTDYTMNVSGVLYTLIWQQNYASTANPRVQVWANQQCLVGDNTGLWFQKGFTALTCQMIPILFADINYIRRTLNVNLAADMDPNYVRIQYYSANRASTGAVTIHFTGSMKPNTAAVSAPTGINFYQDVQATNASSGQVIFKWAEMTPTTPVLGPIVGYRVYYSTTSAPLNTVFPVPTTTYVDTPVNGTGLYQLTHNSLGANKFMYYRIFPIRQNAAYTYTPNPFGLTAGKYLSDPSVPVLPVVVPNNNFIYQHVGRYLIEKGVYNPNMLTHAQAKTACSSRVKLNITQGPSFQQFSYAMIKLATWNIIKARPDSSNYNLTDYPLWLDASAVNIHSTLLPYPAYNPTADIAYLDDNLIFYIKKTGCGTNCSGNTAVANAFGQPNYTSYVEPATNFAGARCFIQLP